MKLGRIEPGGQVIVEIRIGVLGRLGLKVGRKIVRFGMWIVDVSQRDVRKKVMR